jgi:hypothetical protein
MRNVMKPFAGSRLVIAGCIIAVLLGLAMCESFQNKNNLSGVMHPNGKQFAGSAACMSCHPSVFESHIHTDHFLSSRPANAAAIKGSFDPGKNVFELNDRLKVVMKKTDDGLQQVGFVDGFEINSKPIDVVVGSGKNGQTYLYWQDNELFQLPVSYSTPLNGWCNSPGYPTDQILFNRKIPGRCLECHSTYFKSEKTSGQAAVFDRDQVVYGIDCERCHGPAADHVIFQREHPGKVKAKYIVNPALLSRQQKLDNCALCHSGIRENIKPSFSFVVGDKLDDYSRPNYQADSTATLDVHGNQYGLLTASQCFKKSGMDCSSCHDVHVKETNRLELFSQRCMTCHSPGHNFCTQSEVPGLVLSRNCIDCHMPALPSSQVLFQVSDTAKLSPLRVRTHLVGIYNEQVKSYLQKISGGSSK